MSGLAVRNGEAFPLGGVPVGPPDSIHAVLRFRRSTGDRLIALFGAPAPMPECVRCFAVTADDKNSLLQVCAFDVLAKDGSFPSLTPTWTAAHLFEREIAEQFGIRPDGHPWLKPVRGAAPLSGPDLFEPLPGANTRLDAYRFLESKSEEVHEVGVGPVHAGIIEPGHFRFLCHGEKVLHLEISLGYQHRGVERRLIGGPDRRSRVLAESIAGDTVTGHALGYCRAIEGLAAMRVSARAMMLRGIALELERCSNHVGDLGALANDVGFLPGAAWFGRLRGEFLNMLMDLSGNRYGRGLLRPGGVGFDLGPDLVARFVARLEHARKDFAAISEILFTKPSVRGRFEGTGVVPRDVAEDLGMVGPAARASGCERDVRLDFPDGAYRFAHIPLAIVDGGDVAARAQVRRLETERSIAFLLDSLQHLPQGELAAATAPPLAPDSGCIVLTEAWRGECVHAVLTDHAGRFARYKVIDPSFRNWSGLAMALRQEEISDFPLCNKSFNLSYAGHDL